MAERAGVKKETIRELQRGVPLKSVTREEKVIYDFVNQLYAKKRVSDKNFARAHALLGTKGTIELVGILGYYALISMILNVFRMSLPQGEPLPFAERQ
jgi:4-carboxymuconolactone decarboxylase